MSFHPVAPAGTRQGLKAHPGPEGAEIHEIHPGASAADPLRERTLRRPRWLGRLLGSEAGMATAEYAIATLAAVGFAGILVFIMRSDEVRGFLLNLIRTALALP
ncbi:MAG TPA: DUF4244 domain-containing protein [Arthrobacter sp.]|nr:DUF4244 domain-containing protein [Arthrobacter sp.]